jgi:hypothetical protein
MVLTHPELEKWHKLAIREAVGEYGIGVIFVPLYDEYEEEEDLPILQPLDPRTMSSFPASSGNPANRARALGTLDTETKIRINVDAEVDHIINEVISDVKGVMNIE